MAQHDEVFTYCPTEQDLRGPMHDFWYTYCMGKGFYEQAVGLGNPPQPWFNPKLCLKEDIVTYIMMDLQPFIMKHIRASNKAKGFPDGHWYMITITQKDTEDEANILRLHAKTLEFFSERHIEPFMAALEHSNIWHVHYCCRFRDYKKNEQRDLAKLLGRRVQIEKRVSTLKQWNGLNKYIMKRGPHEKKDTSVRLLIDRIGYDEGKGYFIVE